MKSVLVIEDEELLRALIRDLLADYGYRVCEAKNGEEALKLVAMNRFDLVISDIDMPVKNGIEFLKEFRRQDRSTPVVMMSGGFAATEQELFELGANKFIAKPFRNIQSLLQTVMAA